MNQIQCIDTPMKWESDCPYHPDDVQDAYLSTELIDRLFEEIKQVSPEHEWQKRRSSMQCGMISSSMSTEVNFSWSIANKLLKLVH